MAAYLAWGILPVYFKAIAAVPTLEVLAHRILWSVIFLVGLTVARGKWTEFAALLRNRRIRFTLMITTCLIATNWGIFIWAVASGQLVEASLGYFIGPLVTVALGFIFLRERLRRLQAISVGLVLIAILYLTARYGHPPLISMILAFSFAFYGLLRKQVPASGVQGLTVETLMLSPLALAWLVWQRRHGALVFLDTTWSMNCLLMSAGVLTALPLVWFAEGARRLRLVTMGFLQYLAPTGQLLLAVIAFGEAFTHDHLVSFGLIWIALALYSWDTASNLRSGVETAAATGEA